MSKAELIKKIDPFGFSGAHEENTEENLKEILEKMKTSIYKYEETDYDINRVIKSIVNKRDLEKRKQLNEQLEMERFREIERNNGIINNLRSQERYERNSQQRVNYENNQYISPQRTRNINHEINQLQDSIRPPDPVRTERLIDDYTPQSQRRHFQLPVVSNYSNNSFEDDFQRAIALSEKESREEAIRSYQAKIQREKDEEEAKLRAIKYDEEEAAIIASRNKRNITPILLPNNSVTEEIKIDMSRFDDLPSSITEQLLCELCGLLKERKFEEYMQITKTLPPACSVWLSKLKYKGSQLRPKLATRKNDAYMHILERERE